MLNISRICASCCSSSVICICGRTCSPADPISPRGNRQGFGVRGVRMCLLCCEGFGKMGKNFKLREISGLLGDSGSARFRMGVRSNYSYSVGREYLTDDSVSARLLYNNSVYSKTKGYRVNRKALLLPSASYGKLASLAADKGLEVIRQQECKIQSYFLKLQRIGQYSALNYVKMPGRSLTIAACPLAVSRHC